MTRNMRAWEFKAQGRVWIEADGREGSKETGLEDERLTESQRLRRRRVRTLFQEREGQK